MGPGSQKTALRPFQYLDWWWWPVLWKYNLKRTATPTNISSKCALPVNLFFHITVWHVIRTDCWSVLGQFWVSLQWFSLKLAQHVLMFLWQFIFLLEMFQIFQHTKLSQPLKENMPIWSLDICKILVAKFINMSLKEQVWNYCFCTFQPFPNYLFIPPPKEALELSRQF